MIHLLDQIGNVSAAANIQETIIQNGLMKKSKNLSELTNLPEARKNLGFDTNMENFLESLNQNNKFVIGNLIVKSNIEFANTGTITDLEIGRDTYLAVDIDGGVNPRRLPYANENTAGFVYLQNTYDYANYVNAGQPNNTVLSLSAFSNFVNNVYTRDYRALSNSIDPKIRQLYHEYMRVDDNVRVDNPAIARNHLGLHPIAHTGDYTQLENTPSNLSEFSNEFTRFISSFNNLSDLDDLSAACRNLNIGSVAKYDSNNVLILGGNATFSNLTISKHIEYNYDYDVDFQGMFLQSINPQGDCRWRKLPVATSSKKGIVILENDYNKYSDKAASSASALYTVYHQLIGEINGLQKQIDNLKR